MDVNTCMKGRKSCREYQQKKVPYEILGEILEAAVYTPSAGNVQNWCFVVVTDEGKRREIAQHSEQQMWMQAAPVHLVVCNEKERVTKLYPERGELYATQNCAAVAMAILLKAYEKGLGSCWVGAFDVESIKTLLEIPDTHTPEMIITLGYSEEEAKEVSRDKPEFVTYFERFGNQAADFTFFPLRKQTRKLEKKLEKSTAQGKKLAARVKESLKRK